MHFSAPPANIATAAAILFTLSAALILYAYLGYPAWLAIAAACIRRQRALPLQPDQLPSLTLLISAHNEAESIALKLQDSLILRYPKTKLQILLVSDGSTDGTNTIAAGFHSQGVELVEIATQAGKTHAQNVAMAHATGQVVIFSDATTRYHPDSLIHLASSFADPSIGAVSGSYRYQSPASGSTTGGGARAYSTYDNLIRRLQSHVWSITGCCGCIYAVRRSLYTPLAPHIISDLVQPLHILRQGYRVLYEPRAQALELSTASAAKEFHMRVRVVARALQGLASVPQLLKPWQFPYLALQLWSHKLSRWAVPVALAGMLASAAILMHWQFFQVFALLQLGFYLLAALAWMLPLHRLWRPLALPLYFCIVNAAIVAGFLQVLRGKRFVTWTPDREPHVCLR